MELQSGKCLKGKRNFAISRILSCMKLCNKQRTIATSPEAKRLEDETKLRERENILLSTISWYWANVTPSQMCYLLHRCKNGTFLVTKATADEVPNPNYRMAVKLQSEVYIFQVQQHKAELSLDFFNPYQPKAVTLYALVTKMMQASEKNGGVCDVSRGQGTVLVTLKYPVARISSLKAHCRRVIRLKYDKNIIEDLPVPKSIKTYLNSI